MQKLILFTILLCSALGFSQEDWDYLPIELSSNSHGAICLIDGNVVHVVSDYGIFYKTEDGGETWTEYDSNVNVYFLDLAFDGPNNGYTVGAEGKILKTSNAGQTWAELASGTTETLISIAINAQNSIWAVGDNGTVLHSTNGGSSWILDSSLTSERLNSIKFKDENIGYMAGNNGVLFYTENGGVDWEQLTIPTTDDLFSISITENYLYILDGTTNFFGDFTYSAEKSYKSNDNINWTQHFLGNILIGAADLDFINDDLGFAISSASCLCDACNVTINKSVDGGENWDYSLNEETNAANCHANDGYADIEFATEEVGYALLGRYILKTPYSGTAGLEDFNIENAFTIYPNPTINGKFNLKFNVQDTKGLSIEIVDICGKELLVENYLSELNALNIPNISKGIYFVKLLKNGKMVATRKLIKGN